MARSNLQSERTKKKLSEDDKEVEVEEATVVLEALNVRVND